MHSYIDKVLQVKPFEAYPQSVKKEIALVSFWPKGLATPFGSYVFRFQKYASDLDLLERFNHEDEATTVNLFINRLKKIITSLGRSHYFSEFKAGMNHMFDFSVGKLRNGRYMPDSNLFKNIDKLHKLELISNDEFLYITYIIVNVNKFDTNNQTNAYDSVYGIIREKRVLRWSKDEILKGYKIINHDERYTLSQAIRDKEIVKIDLIVLINGKFVEVTNIISLTYTDQLGQIIAINIDDLKIHDVDGLRREIEKLYYSNKFCSPMKVCKRMYSTSRKLNNYDYVSALSQILRGDISLLYQIKSEVEAFIILIERLKNPPILQINRQLDEIKGRLNYVIDIPNKEIIKIAYDIGAVIDMKNKKKKLEMLKTHITLLKNFIFDLCVEKMNMLHLTPIPNIFRPRVEQYSTTIIRKPGDRPNQQFKDFEKNILNLIIKSKENTKENINEMKQQPKENINEMKQPSEEAFQSLDKFMKEEDQRWRDRQEQEAIERLNEMKQQPNKLIIYEPKLQTENMPLTKDDFIKMNAKYFRKNISKKDIDKKYRQYLKRYKRNQYYKKTGYGYY